MSTQPKHILAFDTSGPHVAVVLVSDGHVLGETFEEMARGQAEVLLVRAESLLRDHALDWAELSAIGVGVGPGNFTGIRISVSAARGLSLGLGVPAIGISTFEMLANQLAPEPNMRSLVTLPAPREMVFAQRFQGRTPIADPVVLDLGTPDSVHALGEVGQIVGHRSEDIAQRMGVVARPMELGDIPNHLAAITAQKRDSGDITPPPAPLYVRPADAAPPRDPAPTLLD